MTNVCLISLYSYKLFFPNDERALPFSGSEVQQYYLGRQLATDKEYKVSFIAGNFSAKQAKFYDIQFGDKNVRVYKAVNCGRRNILLDGLLDFWSLYQAMKRASADVYIIRGGGSLAGKVAVIAKMFLKKKFIYSSAHDRDSNGDFFRTHPWYINFLYNYALKSADRIICQHEEQRKAFRGKLGLDALIVRTMYPVDEIPAINESRDDILWVGRLVTWKQPELFMKLARMFSHERFVLITNSDSSYLCEKVKDIHNLQIKQNIPLVEMDDYFRRAKVFINTSSQEGFPNTFVQAAKNGTPILSLNINPDRMIEKNNIGRCSAGDFSQLAKDVKVVLGDKDLWDTLSRSAYGYAKNNHDIKSVIESYKRVLRFN